MTSLHLGQEYCCTAPLNLYQSAAGDGLVTQAQTGRHLKIIALPTPAAPAWQVCLCEDDYPGWVLPADAAALVPAPVPYQAANPDLATIRAALPQVLAFAQAAMAQPNTYLWGGTVGPDYDCSGLVQAAFAAAGVQLPRDAYQQEHFVTPLHLGDLSAGDLLFFGTRDRTTHVALYWQDGNYIHSSGKDQGRNGIGIDSLTNLQDPISRNYHQQLRGAGRVTQSYQATGQPWGGRER
ncbi:MAG TPA: C40 family peptidase [Candidatus Obscuribacterales bacterium]